MRTLFLLAMLLLAATLAYSQGVSINETGAAPDPSAMLDVQSTEKGFLPPRMATIERETILNPATGLVVYDIDENSLFLYDGTEWVPLVAGTGSRWEVNGENIFYNEGNVGIGTSNPTAKFEVAGNLKLASGSAINGFSTSTNLGTSNTLVPTQNAVKSYVDNAIGSIEESDPTWSGAASISGSIGRTGDVGIGTETPAAPLHVRGIGTGEGNVLFEGLYKGVFNAGNPPAAGEGTRMMWYPDKAAFRAGRVSGTSAANWDKDSIGGHSFATGWNTKARGNSSTAMGLESHAQGVVSTAIGGYNIASGDYSIAMGGWTSATDDYSTAMGLATIASGLASTAMGNSSTASVGSSTAMGYQANAAGFASLATGIKTTASGLHSTAMGSHNTAPSLAETVIGLFNTVYTPSNSTTWNSNDRLFVIGNGQSEDTRSDALVMLKNGNTGFGVSNPQARLHINGRIILTNGVIQRGGSPITATNDLGLYSRNPGSWIRFVTHNAPIAFFTENGTNGTGANEAMRITNTGIVGIGTSAPSANSRLDVNGNIRTSAQIIISSNGTVWMQTDAQNVLDVDGTIRPMVNAAFNIGNSSKRWNTIFATNGTINTSDERLKSNVTEVQYGLNEILQMRPVSFYWSELQSQEKKLGLIAQDLLTLIPEVVVTKDSHYNSETGEFTHKEAEYLGVMYSDLIPVLIKGMQEQQEMINKLKNSNKDLASEITKLHNHNSELSSRLHVLETSLYGHPVQNQTVKSDN